MDIEQMEKVIVDFSFELFLTKKKINCSRSKKDDIWMG